MNEHFQFLAPKMDYERLSIPLGKENFVKYPERWFLEIESAVTTDASPLDRTLVLRRILNESDGLPDNVFNHLTGALIWASSSCPDSQKAIHGSIQFLCADENHNASLSLQESFLKLDVRFHPSLNVSCLYLSVVIALLKYEIVSSFDEHSLYVYLSKLFKTEMTPETNPITGFDVLQWVSTHRQVSDSRTMSFFENVIHQAYDVVNKGMRQCALSLLSKLATSCFQPIQTLGLWNSAVVLSLSDRSLLSLPKIIEVLELCSTGLKENVFMSFEKHIRDSNLTLPVVYQQLALYYYLINKSQLCRHFCQLAVGLFEKMYQENPSWHLAGVYKFDIAVLKNDEKERSQLFDAIQASEIELMSDIGIHNPAQSFASSCVLLARSYSLLNSGDIQIAYDYFRLSLKQSEVIEGTQFFSDYKLVNFRYFSQLYNLYGYFSTLQGNLENAVLQYSKSYSYNQNNVRSVYNQCLLLLKLGKSLEAKSNWSAANVMCSDVHHSFHKLSVYFQRS